MESRVGRPLRRKAKPADSREVIDLGSRFGVSFHGSSSDTSDEDFTVDMTGSEDSPNSSGDESNPRQGDQHDQEDDKDDAMEINSGPSNPDSPSSSYNPLVVRRSNRAIKPTKDIDLYLLGAKFGLDLEGSEADSSDPEFSPQNKEKEGSVSGSSLSSSASSGDSSPGPDIVVQSHLPAAVSKTKTVERSSESSPIDNHTSLASQPLCAVCLEDSQTDCDIVECDWCGISVHEGCYGVPEDDGVNSNSSSLSSFTTIPWFCDACKAGLSPKSCQCDLCPTVGGLFKQSANGRWLHVVCVLYIPGIEYVDPESLSGVTLDRLPASKWGAKECSLCEDPSTSKTGVCIGCDAGLCRSTFHVTCAQKYGLLCEGEDTDSKDLIDPYFAHCKSHADKDLARKKKRNYIAAMNQQKCFVRDHSNARIQRYLNQAKADYARMFKDIQSRHGSVNSLKNDDRLLQYLPSAFHQLVQKDNSMEYENETAGHVARRMVPPGLNHDFVSYFHERQSRVTSTEVNNEQLIKTNSDLRSEELVLKNQLSSTQRELNLLKSKGLQLQSQANSLYTNLSRVTKRNHCLPEGLNNAAPERESTPVISCVECSNSNDPHLMVLCDTCNKYYHIGCVDPPITKVPKKTSKWGWECHRCYRTSSDREHDLLPKPKASHSHEPSSRSGRRIQPPKQLIYYTPLIWCSSRNTGQLTAPNQGKRPS